MIGPFPGLVQLILQVMVVVLGVEILLLGSYLSLIIYLTFRPNNSGL